MVASTPTHNLDRPASAASRATAIDPKLLALLEPAYDDIESIRAACEAFRVIYRRLREEIAKVIVGQDAVVEQTLVAIFANGHVLLEGVPGLGKTLLVRTLSETLRLPFARIQFTPDLMPADITGTSVVLEDAASGNREFTFKPGPIFHQLILADEINRATPKSQAALLEAMQERAVTIAGQTRSLGSPFFVLATQNPIEQEGTYPLPEAQLDRFLLKITVPYASRAEVNHIIGRTTRTGSPTVSPVLDGDAIIKAQRLARKIIVAPHVQDYAIRLVMATHPGSQHAVPHVTKHIAVGVSPRGAQAVIACAKVMALLEGRFAVSMRDVQTASYPALRHRIIRSFEAEADGMKPDDIIRRLIEATPRELDPAAPSRSQISRPWWLLAFGAACGGIMVCTFIIALVLSIMYASLAVTMPLWSLIVTTALALVGLAGVAAMMQWSRWGACIIAAAVALIAIVLVWAGAQPAVTIVASLVVLSLMWATLTLGGDRRIWPLMHWHFFRRPET